MYSSLISRSVYALKYASNPNTASYWRSSHRALSKSLVTFGSVIISLEVGNNLVINFTEKIREIRHVNHRYVSRTESFHLSTSIQTLLQNFIVMEFCCKFQYNPSFNRMALSASNSKYKQIWFRLFQIFNKSIYRPYTHVWDPQGVFMTWHYLMNDPELNQKLSRDYLVFSWSGC